MVKKQSLFWIHVSIHTPPKTNGWNLFHYTRKEKEKHRPKPPIVGFHVTLPETNIAPKNGWLEYFFPIGDAYFQGLC